jgi:probable HAF family extracellular repeat protein
MVTWGRQLAGCLALALPAWSFGQAFTLTNLGQPGWNYSIAHGINQAGNVVGEFASTNAYSATHAFLFANGTVTALGFAGTYDVAYGLNDLNVVIGEAGFGLFYHGFAYSNGVTTELAPLGGSAGPESYSAAYAINRSGLIVGESTTASLGNSPIHATLWSGTAINNLGVLTDGVTPGDYSSGFGINNSNIVVGESDYVPSHGLTNTHAFVYTNATSGMKDLGTLGGTYSSATAINDSGAIVGASTISGDTETHAFVWRDGVMTDLGTFGGGTNSASAINNAGQIVGYSTDANGISHAFLYAGGKLLNLNDYIPPGSVFTNLATADAINDAGQIAGSGYTTDPNNYYQACLLTPATAWISLGSPAITKGQVQFSIFGPPGQRFALEGCTNLAGSSGKWVWLATNTLSGSSTNYTETQISNCRYYRALLLP